MEAMEASAVDAAVLWLMQTILANLLLGKLDEWLRQVGLADDIQKLRVEIERVEGIVCAGKGRAIGNRPLARLLARLKVLLYDAGDVVDELDYYRLQQQVEKDTFACATESEGTGVDEAEQADGSRQSTRMPSNRSSRLRSEVWTHFDPTEVDKKDSPTKARCKYCHAELKCEAEKGRPALLNHIRKSKACIQIREGNDQPRNPLSERDSSAPNDTTEHLTHNSTSRKRGRQDEALTENTVANPHPWDKAGFSNTIKQIARQNKRHPTGIDRDSQRF
ncbi:hypothetical protein EJB05_38277 [Eragrostis curvula]|uniref:BED-type domain-containing protein n=1 Tax=Eragrostis curvula TaxID=38414 RepID=A0A5J9TTV3_9POAL|nr:hypothetical protein EJB05_38277 [Eragrostis curvula]